MPTLRPRQWSSDFLVSIRIFHALGIHVDVPRVISRENLPAFAETPLTLATTLKKPSKVIIALVNGGALLDYRTKEGLTAMHRAVERNSLEAVKTLLELGASPNYKDTKGLTPLYYSVIYKTDPMLCETLLHDHATIGAQDLQGWQEVHQVSQQFFLFLLYHFLKHCPFKLRPRLSNNGKLIIVCRCCMFETIINTYRLTETFLIPNDGYLVFASVSKWSFFLAEKLSTHGFVVKSLFPPECVSFYSNLYRSDWKQTTSDFCYERQ